MQVSQIDFTDNPAIKGREDHYEAVTVSIPAILKSWRHSLFSFEWLTADGRIKAPEDLPEGERSKRRSVEDLLARGEPLETPVLGIGLMENVEIGAGKAVFLTLAAHQADTIPVHIPKSHAGDFKPFLT